MSAATFKPAPRRVYGSQRSTRISDWDELGEVFPGVSTPLVPTAQVKPELPAHASTAAALDEEETLILRQPRPALAPLAPLPKTRRPRNKQRVSQALSAAKSCSHSTAPSRDETYIGTGSVVAPLVEEASFPVPDDRLVSKRRRKGAAVALPLGPLAVLSPPMPPSAPAIEPELCNSSGSSEEGGTASPSAVPPRPKPPKRQDDLQSRFRRVTMGLPSASLIHSGVSFAPPAAAAPGRPSIASWSGPAPPASAPVTPGQDTTLLGSVASLPPSSAAAAAPPAPLRCSVGAASAALSVALLPPAPAAAAAAVAAVGESDSSRLAGYVDSRLTAAGKTLGGEPAPMPPRVPAARDAAPALGLPQRGLPLGRGRQRPPPPPPPAAAAVRRDVGRAVAPTAAAAAPAVAAAAVAPPLPSLSSSASVLLPNEAEAAGEEWLVAAAAARDLPSPPCVAPPSSGSLLVLQSAAPPPPLPASAPPIATNAPCTAAVARQAAGPTAATAVGAAGGTSRSEREGGGCSLPGDDSGSSSPAPSSHRDTVAPAHSSSSSARALACCLPAVLQFAWAPAALLGGPAPLVSREWRRVAATVYSWAVALGVPAYAAAASASAAKGRKKKGGKGGGAGAPDDGRGGGPPPVLRPLRALLDAFPWGCHLADGAYKQVRGGGAPASCCRPCACRQHMITSLPPRQVYRVWNAAAAREEAVSVMALGALAQVRAERRRPGCVARRCILPSHRPPPRPCWLQAASLATVAAEVQVGCLASDLARTGVCPNMLVTHQVTRGEKGSPLMGARL